MKTELMNIISTDKLELPAVLFESERDCDKIAIFLHGNGDSGVFYKIPMINAMANALTKKGIALLALNNRGARYMKQLIVAGSGTPGQEERVMGGAHYELIEDSVKDIDGAVGSLKNKGYKEFYLLGFSTGANKICVYDRLIKNNPFSKYVHAGPGDDSGLFFNEIGEKKFWLALEFARAAVKLGSPLKVMPKYTGMNPFSAQSALDILDPEGPYNTFPYFEATTKRLGKKRLFSEYSAITKPMLVIFGENDEFTYTGGGTAAVLEILRQRTNKKSLPKSDFQIIPGTDHGFHGAEEELAERMADWLSS